MMTNIFKSVWLLHIQKNILWNTLYRIKHIDEISDCKCGNRFISFECMVVEDNRVKIEIIVWTKHNLNFKCEKLQKMEFLENLVSKIAKRYLFV
jgi:hypothetical protein